jgi:general secretion pathway protein D
MTMNPRGLRANPCRRAGKALGAMLMLATTLAGAQQPAQPQAPEAQSQPVPQQQVPAAQALPPATQAPTPQAQPAPSTQRPAPQAQRPARAANAGPNPALRSGAQVTVNFVNADIEAVTRAMGAMIERQIIVDPRVKGTITVYSEQPVSVREAYLNYLAALRGLGFTLVDSAGLLKVVPEADAKLQTGTVSIGAPGVRGDQVLTQIFKLNHENPNNLVAVLRPLISPNNTINANPGNNTLVITDYADNLQRIARIIAALDTPGATDVEVIPIRHGVASDLAVIIQRLGDGAVAGAPVPGGPGAGGPFTVLVDPRANALILRASNPVRMASLRALVQRLDQPLSGPAAGSGNIWVVHLKNADATKLATVLRAAFPGPGGAGSGGGSAITSPTQQQQQQQQQQPGIGGVGGGSTQATAPLSASAQPSTGGFIQADPSSNSLIITAPEPLYRQVRTMIEQLDTRRAQVYIESLIVEVIGDNAADFGFQWQGLIGQSGDKYGLFAGTNSQVAGPSIIALTQTITGGGSGTTSPATPGEGLNIGLLRNYGGVYALAAIARFLQSQTNTNIVSTPNLITLDNEEAKIVVGSNVPFVTGQFTQTAGAVSNPFQTIERKDVGITLRIKPQVGEGGTVRMVIFQEASSISQQVAPGTSNAGPSTDKRSIESTVVVDDGAILVLGGLIEDRFTDQKSKVPVLGDLPVVGTLFRSETRTRKRTNLMVFLRPVVLRDGESATKLSVDRYDIIRARQKETQPAPSYVLPINEAPIVSERAPAAASSTLDPPPLPRPPDPARVLPGPPVSND